MTTTYIKDERKLTDDKDVERLRCGCGCMKFAVVISKDDGVPVESVLCLNCRVRSTIETRFTTEAVK